MQRTPGIGDFLVYILMYCMSVCFVSPHFKVRMGISFLRVV